MNIVKEVATRATCDRGKTASIVVKDKRILVTGYVGSPAGLPHCDEVGHEMHKVTRGDGTETNHCIRTIHTEQNAIAQAAKTGIALDGSTYYCHMVPCYVCAKLFVNCGIKKVVAKKDYHAAEETKRIFKESGIELVILENEMETYDNM